jgi:hypothetical protein
LGNHSISVAYSGDASFSASSAGPVGIAVAKGPTQTILFIPTGALPNSSVVLQAIVLPNGAIDPTGMVQFFTGKTALGIPVQLKSLIATLTTTQLAGGSNSITAVYSGDANFVGSTSSAATLVVGNPDFKISANPGNVTISGSAGSSNLLLTPGPGVGFVGTVTLTCSGLPMGSSCTFLPAQPNLDGFTPLTVALSISKPTGLSAAIRRALPSEAKRFAGSLGGATLAACAILLAWPRKKRAWQLSAVLVLAGILSAMSGCSGKGSGALVTNGPSTNFFIATVTASGGTGAQAVSHTLTLAVTVQ